MKNSLLLLPRETYSHSSNPEWRQAAYTGETLDMRWQKKQHAVYQHADEMDYMRA
jgi:hypothetical protein